MTDEVDRVTVAPEIAVIPRNRTIGQVAAIDTELIAAITIDAVHVGHKRSALSASSSRRPCQPRRRGIQRGPGRKAAIGEDNVVRTSATGRHIIASDVIALEPTPDECHEISIDIGTTHPSIEVLEGDNRWTTRCSASKWAARRCQAAWIARSRRKTNGIASLPRKSPGHG